MEIKTEKCLNSFQIHRWQIEGKICLSPSERSVTCTSRAWQFQMAVAALEETSLNTWLLDPKLFWCFSAGRGAALLTNSFWTINWEDLVLGPECLKANRRVSDLYKNASEIIMSCSRNHKVLHKQLAIEYYSCFLLFGLFLLTIQCI